MIRNSMIRPGTKMEAEYNTLTDTEKRRYNRLRNAYAAWSWDHRKAMRMCKSPLRREED